jgi:hypothetical protein
VPRCDLTDIRKEVNELRNECGDCEPLAYSTVWEAWSKHPMLTHVRMHRDKRNFQDCSVCVSLRVLLKSARAQGDSTRVIELQAMLRTHRLLQRTERERYYFRRALAQQPNAPCLSLIFDKWSSWTTIVPYFGRSIGGEWRQLKEDVLHLHVMLVRVHGAPNRNYFFSANESIKSGGNFTVETVRRTLEIHMAGQPLPPTLYLLSDSGEKCFVVLLYLGTLVEIDKTNDVFYNQLIVDHTHEDVDSQFGVGSQHLSGKHGGHVLTPGAFYGAMSKAFPENMVWTQVKSVNDWEDWFGTKKGESTQHCRVNKSITGIRTQREKVEPTEEGRVKGEKVGPTKEGKVKGKKHSPKAFWLHKHDNQMALHYKEYDCDPLWLPLLRDPFGNIQEPRSTDPAGIPFPTTPKDGLKGDFSRLHEVELISAKIESEMEAAAAHKAHLARGDSSDEELMVDGHGENKPTTSEAKQNRAPYDPLRVVGAVKKLATFTKSISEAGESFITNEMLGEWDAWASAEVSALADMSLGERTSKVVLGLPNCKGAPPTGEVVRGAQMELMTWKDGADSSRGLTMTQKQQDALETRKLTLEDIVVGDCCLFASNSSQSALTSVDSTPFWLADVVAKDTASETLTIHWRGSFENGSPSASPNGKWHLLCHCVADDTLHPIPKSRRQCAKRGHEPLQDTQQPLLSVVMNGIQLNADLHLSKPTMKKIPGIGGQLSQPLAYSGVGLTAQA